MFCVSFFLLFAILFLIEGFCVERIHCRLQCFSFGLHLNSCQCRHFDCLLLLLFPNHGGIIRGNLQGFFLLPSAIFCLLSFCVDWFLCSLTNPTLLRLLTQLLSLFILHRQNFCCDWICYMLFYINISICKYIQQVFGKICHFKIVLLLNNLNSSQLISHYFKQNMWIIFNCYFLPFLFIS